MCFGGVQFRPRTSSCPDDFLPSSLMSKNFDSTTYEDKSSYYHSSTTDKTNPFIIWLSSVFVAVTMMFFGFRVVTPTLDQERLSNLEQENLKLKQDVDDLSERVGNLNDTVYDNAISTNRRIDQINPEVTVDVDVQQGLINVSK